MKPDLEDVLQKWLDIFQAQLPAAIEAVDAAKPTPLNPSDPIEWIFGDKENLPQMPCLIVTGHNTQTTKDELYRIQSYQVEVDIYAQLDDVETLSRIMRRYGAALDDTIRSNNTVAGLWRNISGIQSSYWDALAQKDGGLFQAVHVQFVATVVTD